MENALAQNVSTSHENTTCYAWVRCIWNTWGGQEKGSWLDVQFAEQLSTLDGS